MESYHRVRWYTLSPPEQPNPPRAARRRRPRGVRRRSRHRRLVDHDRPWKSRKGIWRDSMARIEGPVVSHPGRDRGELARVPRRDPDGPNSTAAAPAGRRAGVHVNSSPADRATVVARAVSDAPRRGASATSRSPRRTSCPTGHSGRRSGHGQAGGPRRGDRAGRRHRSAWVRLASRRLYGQMLAAGVRIFEYDAADDSRQNTHRRRSVGRDRHHQRRQPIVRAQRRGQRGRPGRSDCGPIIRGLRSRRRA